MDFWRPMVWLTQSVFMALVEFSISEGSKISLESWQRSKAWIPSTGWWIKLFLREHCWSATLNFPSPRYQNTTAWNQTLTQLKLGRVFKNFSFLNVTSSLISQGFFSPLQFINWMKGKISKKSGLCIHCDCFWQGKGWRQWWPHYLA